MTQQFVVVPVGFDVAEATRLSVDNNAAGYFTGIPPIWADQAQSEGWVLPCIIVQSLEDEGDVPAGSIISWRPIDATIGG
jgi:hypothetical protein